MQLVGSTVALILAAVLVACVADEVTTPNSETSDAGDAAAGGDGSTNDAATPHDSGVIGDAGADGGPSACQSYCNALSSKCSATSAPDVFPDLPTCLAFCATLPSSGASANSLECRLGYLADADCPAAGPWATDNDTQNLCGSDAPCLTICTAAAPKCDSADASLGSVAACQDTCDTASVATGGVAAITCYKTHTLEMYAADASAASVAAACAAWQACN